MKGHGEKLSRKQEQAIANLLVAPTIATAAQQTGIGEPTLYRWLKDENFQTAYRTARRQVVQHAIVQVQGAVPAPEGGLRAEPDEACAEDGRAATLELERDAHAAGSILGERDLEELAGRRTLERECLCREVADLDTNLHLVREP